VGSVETAASTTAAVAGTTFAPTLLLLTLVARAQVAVECG
jgi:hypothetical protein